MERIRAEEQLDEAAVAALPWADEESRADVVAEMQRRIAGEWQDPAPGEVQWGGGYGSNVDSVSMDAFREEARRGVSG